MESTTGVTSVALKANGRITKCTGKALSVGRMDDIIQVAMWKIKKREKVHSHGQMAVVMTDLGRMVSNTEEGNSQIDKVKSKKVSGLKAKEYFGMMSMETE